MSYQGSSLRPVREDSLGPFEMCRLARQLSKRCGVSARRAALEDSYEGICADVDGFYEQMKFGRCVATVDKVDVESGDEDDDGDGEESYIANVMDSPVLKEYLVDNVSVNLFKLR